MSKGIRPRRVAEMIRQEISSLLNKGFKDPRIGFVSVMRVEMSPDLRYANVYVSLFGVESERKSSLIALRNGAGWMRRELGKHLRMRFTPEVRFFPDDTLDTVYQLEDVFEKIHEEEARNPMRRLSREEVLEEFRQAESFVLTSHTSPDGDAVGSLLGAWHLLRAMGKTNAVCVLADPVPEMYGFLDGASKILPCDADSLPGEFDLAVLVDAGVPERAGDAERVLLGGRRLLILDHHLEDGPPGSMGFIENEYAATGEIVAELFELAELTPSVEAATCLYVAQATDTGGYRFSNTNARTHRIAAALHEAGVDTADVCNRVFDTMPRPQVELLRRVLGRVRFACGGRVAHTYVTKQDMDEAGARLEDLNNLVNYARNIEGVEVGVLFRDDGPDAARVSMRVRGDFDAAAFLREFGGGGHKAAAGATVRRPLAETQQAVLDRIETILGGKPA